MNIGNNLSMSFDYTKKLFGDFGRLLILIIISIIPIVNFIMLGYVMKVAKETPDSNQPPALNQYGTLFFDGLKAIIVGIVYLIIPIAILGVGISAFLVPGMPSLVGAGATIIFSVIGLIALFIVSIIFFMALVNFAKYGSISKAFAFSEIFGIIKSVGWGSYILWTIVMFIILVIEGAIGSIPAIGWVIALVIAPVFATFLMRSAGLVYAEGKSGVQPYSASTSYPPPPPPPTTASSPAAGTKTFCTNCGSENNANVKFCYKCGKELAKG